MPRRKKLEMLPDGQVRIGDTEVLKAIADPLRLELLTLLTAPKTAKELAGSLGVPTTRLYYHLRVLEGHGLIKVVSTRLVSGIEEKTYRSIGNNWAPAPELTVAAIEASGVVGSIANLMQAQLTMALRGDPSGHIGELDSAVPVLTLTRLSFDAESLAEFQKRLYELIEEYVSDAPVAREGEELYHLFAAVYRYSQGAPEAKTRVTKGRSRAPRG